MKKRDTIDIEGYKLNIIYYPENDKYFGFIVEFNGVMATANTLLRLKQKLSAMASMYLNHLQEQHLY